MRTSHAVLGVFGAMLLVSFPRPALAGGTAQVVVDYAGYQALVPGCSVCGNDFAVTVDATVWSNGERSFADPLPAGAVLQSVEASLDGACDGAWPISLSGQAVGSSTLTGTVCNCDGCGSGSTATSAIFVDGWPGYAYGVDNTVQVDGSAAPFAIAVDEVQLTLHYALCLDGILDPGETCDGGAETAGCDVDCTPAVCGDTTVNVTAGEACDDGGETASCDADCTTATCGDGVLNTTAGEVCDDGGESAACDDDCTPAACGDGTTNAAAGEDCDDGAESATCNADCTAAVCGDGQINATAGEVCDDGGRSATCNADCTLVSCGDGVVNTTAGEACDDAGESALCNADCTSAVCGDSKTNATAGETCDEGAESADCDDDCTDAECGDGNVNAAAGEACDDGNTTNADGCASDCSIEGSGGAGGGGPSGGSTTSAGAGGDGGDGGGGGDADETAEDGGCGCRTSDGDRGATWLLALGVALALRRPRSASRQRRR